MSSVPQEPVTATPVAGAELADFGQRAIAAIIDALVIGVALSILWLPIFILSKIPFLGWLIAAVGWLGIMAVPWAYCIFCWAYDNPIGLKGQTLGKKLMNIKVVMDDGSDLTPQQAVIRCVGYIADLGIGVLLALRPDRKALHDLIANTKVVKL